MGGGEVLKKGWLIKSPPLDSGGIKAWRKRFFRLRSSKILEYYKSEDGDLKGVINLEDCKAVNSDLFHKKYKHVFDIETQDRVFYLVASSAEEMTAWVKALCNICGFILRPQIAGDQQAQTLGIIKSSKNDAIISPPVSTLPQNISGSLLSENFGTEQPQTDFYSLASAAVYDVSTKLGKSAEIPSGTSLSDALIAKGMPPTPITGIYSQATPLPDSSYFSPRSPNVSSLYAVPQKKNKAPERQSMNAASEPTPKHQPLTTTKSDAGPVSSSLSSENEQAMLPGSTSISGAYRPAEMMANGYMTPSQWLSKARSANYSYVSGPPRPADGSPNTHHSALIKSEEEPSSSEERSGSHTYINMRQLQDVLDTPPQIDRSNKPSDSPPRVKRELKPGTKQAEEDSPPGTPPDFPTRTGSVSMPEGMDGSDLPKPTKRTMKYTQLEFNDEGQLLSLADEPPLAAVRGPIPVPRGQKRVNYSAIDIKATADRANETTTEKDPPVDRQLSLTEAEMAALKEKPYVNVSHEGIPDEDTDPDYYTHMRNLPPDSLLYVLMTKQGDAEREENLYQEPKDTLTR